MRNGSDDEDSIKHMPQTDREGSPKREADQLTDKHDSGDAPERSAEDTVADDDHITEDRYTGAESEP